MSVAIQYGDVAPGAKENFEPSVSSEMSFSKVEQLKLYNLSFPNYGNPCEQYSVPLDGNTVLLPDDTSNANIGLWSEEMTDANGDFTNPVVLTLTSEGQYTSQGLTLTFDRENNIFCTDLNIKWYRNNQLISNADFEPDSAFYYCDNRVENYDKVVITFYSLNMPYNRLKLKAVDYGYGTVFGADQLKAVKITQSINTASTTISINTCDFTLTSNSDMQYDFQNKQPLTVTFNDRLIATTFVSSSKRTARRVWDVQSEDYIGIMDTVYFYGDMYTDKNAYDLLVEIFDRAKVPYNIDARLQNVTVSGLIKYSTCREALMQVAFATMTCVDTSNTYAVKVFYLSDTVVQTIPLNRQKTGQTINKGSIVTRAELTAHTYALTDEWEAPIWANEGEENAYIGEEFLITFNSPLADLQLTGGTMLDSSVSHAHFIATDTAVYLRGHKYDETTKIVVKKNPIVLANEVENVKTIENATLVTPQNVDLVLNFWYNKIIKTNTITSDVVEGRHVTGGEMARYGFFRLGIDPLGEVSPKTVTYDSVTSVGEVDVFKTPYMGDIEARITEQTFNLNGGIIVKETTAEW